MFDYIMTIFRLCDQKTFVVNSEKGSIAETTSVKSSSDFNLESWHTNLLNDGHTASQTGTNCTQ